MADHSRQNSSAPASTNLILVVALIALTAVLAYQTWARNAPHRSNGVYSPRVVTPREDLGADEYSAINVFQEASPSVVFIRTKGYQPVLFRGIEERELSSGTGFVWDDQGHIVTNRHVIEEHLISRNIELEVQFADKTIADAELVGAVQEHDIAVLKIDPAGLDLKPIRLGTSNDLQVGQRVLAIGSPFGFDQTLSTGVIGGLNRIVGKQGSQEPLSGLIQTDAAINPGNSGGPLLDSSGRLIGVNTAIVSPTGAYSGLGFAVPSNSVVMSVDRVLRESTNDPTPVLGFSVFDPAEVATWGVPARINNRGLFVRQVYSHGPAAQTDLRATKQMGYRMYLGDQIAALNDSPISSVEGLHNELQKYKVGDIVTLTVYRENVPGRIEIELESETFLFE